MTKSILIFDDSKFLICYEMFSGIFVRGISIKEKEIYDKMSFDKVITREYKSFDDIKHIIDDYEHNN